MIVNQDILRLDTLALLAEINKQIDAVKSYAEINGTDVYKMRDADGNWPMVGLLQAKSQVYATLVSLQAKK